MDGAYMEDMMEGEDTGGTSSIETLSGESLLMQRTFGYDLEGSGYDMHFAESESGDFALVSSEENGGGGFDLPSGYDVIVPDCNAATETVDGVSMAPGGWKSCHASGTGKSTKGSVVVTVGGDHDDSSDEERPAEKARASTASLVQIEEQMSRGQCPGDTALGMERSEAGGGGRGRSISLAAGRQAKKDERTARMDWTGEFQKILSMEDAKEKYLALYSLANDFVYAAKTYGKIIISEIHLAQADKTIKSIDAGGVAGGAKYLRHSIFFKLVVDTLLNRKEAACGEPEVWMYGGSERNDAFAMKAAAHDLQALIAFYNTRCEGINFPLMAIIDYRGYRLIAMSILPVNGESLIYGCCDGGKNVFASDPVFNEKMKQMCTLMNLKEHLVMDKTLHCCGDIEGHQGTDGKYYLLDFARLFPPEAPSKEYKPKGRSVFYQHLRPEFLMSYEEPLSSDAFSGWGKRDPLTAEHNSAVRRATNHLYNVTIKEFAEHLDEVALDVLSPSFSLTEEMHHAGINVRHLGRIRAHAQHPAVSSLLLTEMVARVLKAEINGILRKTMLQSPGNLPLKVPYRDAVLRYFNMLISADPTDTQLAVQFWTSSVKSLLVDKFTKLALYERERQNSWDLRLSIGHHHAYLFRRLIDLTSIKINKKILDDLDNSQHMFDLQFHFISSDIISIGARVKHMNVVDEAEANVLLFDAMNCYGVQAEQVWAVVNRKFNNAMASSTFNFRTLNQWASALYEHASRQLSASAARALLNDAGRKTARVLQMQPTYHPALFLYGRIMVLQGALCDTGSDTQFQCLRAAVQHFIDSIDAFPDNYDRLVNAAKEAYDEAVELAKTKSHRRRAHRTFLLSSMMYKAASMAGRASAAPLSESAAAAAMEEEENKLLYHMGLSMYQCAAHGPSVNNHFMEGLIMEAAQAIEAYLMLLPVAALADKRFVYCVDQRREYKQLQRTVEVYERQDAAPRKAIGRKASEDACVANATGMHYFHRREDMTHALPARHRVMLSPIYCLCSGNASLGMQHINEASKWVASEGIGCTLPPCIFDVVLEYHPVDFFELQEIILRHPQVDSGSSHPAKVLFFATTDLPVTDQYNGYNGNPAAHPPEHGRRRRGTATRNLPEDVTVQANGLTPIATIDSFGEQVSKHVLPSPVTAKFLLIKILPANGAKATSLRHVEFMGRHVLDRTGQVNTPTELSPREAKGSSGRDGLLSPSELLSTMEEFSLFSAAFEVQQNHLAVLLQMGSASPLLNLLIQCHLRMCSLAPTLSKFKAGASFSFNAPARRNSVFESRNNYQAINMANSKCITQFVVTTIVANCPKLLSINLEGCPYITDRAVETLVKHCKSLGKIYLAGCNQLSDASLNAVVTYCPSLSEFSMWEMEGDQQQMSKLAGFTRLQSLSIPNNAGLTDKLLSSIIRKAKALEELKIPNCRQVTNKGIKSAASRCSELSLVDISGVIRLTSEGVASLSRLSHLTCLQMGHLRITDAAVVDLALYHHNITSWDLRKCTSLTDAAICTLAANVPNLMKLNLSGVSGVSETALQYAIMGGRSLTEVVLENTQATDIVVEMLVARHSRLAKLDISNCPLVTDNAVLALCSAMALEKLSVCGSAKIKSYALLQLLQRCRSLRRLNVTGCANMSEVYIMRMKNAAPHVDILFKEEEESSHSSPSSAAVPPPARREPSFDGSGRPRIDRRSERVISSRRLSNRRSSSTLQRASRHKADDSQALPGPE